MAEEVQDKDILLYLLDFLLDYHNGEICLNDEQLDEYRGYVERIYAAVARGKSVYQTLAMHDSFEIQEEAKALLQRLANHTK